MTILHPRTHRWTLVLILHRQIPLFDPITNSYDTSMTFRTCREWSQVVRSPVHQKMTLGSTKTPICGQHDVTFTWRRDGLTLCSCREGSFLNGRWVFASVQKIPSYVNLRLSLHLALEKTSDSILMIEKKKKQNTSRLWAFNHNEGWILPPKRKKKKKNKKTHHRCILEFVIVNKILCNRS